MKAELIVALDVARSSDLSPILEQLPPEVKWFKIGLELFCAEGPAALGELKKGKKHIFLDLKLHDIPRTVERAVRSAGNHGVSLLTVHAVGGRAMLEAAAYAARELGDRAPKLIAVTTLTSLNENDFADMGIQRSVPEQALALGRLAINSGIDGLVCSPHEAEALRTEFGPEPILVTPGIRLPSESAGDQKRIATPGMAVRAGATFLVVGRTIVQAPDPAMAARQVLADMQAAVE